MSLMDHIKDVFLILFQNFIDIFLELRLAFDLVTYVVSTT